MTRPGPTAPARTLGAAVRAVLLPLGSALLLGGCAASAARYATPEAASDALAAAVRADSTEQLDTVFGSDGAELVSSGDEVADRNLREAFLGLYDAGHRIEREGPESATLVVGQSDWPFPVPLVQDPGGAWSFDTEAGAEEVVNRRIGRNELDTIETCRAIVDAQREYAAMSWAGKPKGEYAHLFLSREGSGEAGGRDGLYWPTGEGEPPSPLGPLVAEAQAEGYSVERGAAGPQPYHGYLYRMLTAQGRSAPGGQASYVVDGKLTGGFAVIAWPVEYGSSGLASFLVGTDGVVYEADLGEDTGRLADRTHEYDPDARWNVCME